ncbi:glutathionylspermidine synthase family protein [Bacillus pacificus]
MLFLCKNKSVLALIWQLYEEEVFFEEEERGIIQNYFLPTYFTNKPFIERNESYVSKPLYGREGGGVSIYENNELLAEDKTEYYLNMENISATYIEMPELYNWH